MDSKVFAATLHAAIPLNGGSGFFPHPDFPSVVFSTFRDELGIGMVCRVGQHGPSSVKRYTPGTEELALISLDEWAQDQLQQQEKGEEV